MNNVLLIGGHRKSGTTMLSRLFDGHKKIAVSPTDINVLYAYFPEWTKPKYSDAEKSRRLEKVVIEPFKKAEQQANGDIDFDCAKYKHIFLSLIDKIDKSDINSVVKAIVTAHIESLRNGKDWLVLKETTSEVYAPNLLTANPGWKFLHLIRDPRDNYAAIKAGFEKKYSKIGNDYIDTLASVLVRYEYGIKWLRWNLIHFGLHRYFLMRFEDLVDSTEYQMKHFAQWLDVEWSKSLLTPTYGNQMFEGNSHDGIKFSGVDSQNVGKWKERIDYDEAALIEFVLKDEMDWLGYKRETDEMFGSKKAAEFYAEMNYKYFFADNFK